jgi:hypothetical protein
VNLPEKKGGYKIDREKMKRFGAHRGDGKRYVVHTDEKLTAFLEWESAIRAATAEIQTQQAKCSCEQ